MPRPNTPASSSSISARNRSPTPHASREDINPNTAWIHRRGFKRFYVFLIVGIFFVLNALGTSKSLNATITLQLHAMMSFLLLHWNKGVPDGGLLQEDDAHKTFWEQLDGDYLYTPTRKFLMAVPIFLFFASVALTGNDLVPLVLNAAATLFLTVVPKHGALFGVRLFGINKLE